ncbi:MAG: CopG family transcriptional regulator [bacterium]
MKRVNVVLGDQEVRALAKLARERHQSKSATVRQLIREKAPAPDPGLKARLEAWRRLTSMNLPVADVETMKRETMEGMLGIRKSDAQNP